MNTSTMPAIRPRGRTHHVEVVAYLVAAVVGLGGGWVVGATLDTRPGPSSLAVPALPSTVEPSLAPTSPASTPVTSEPSVIPTSPTPPTVRVEVPVTPAAVLPVEVPTPTVQPDPPAVEVEQVDTGGNTEWAQFERARAACELDGGTWTPGVTLADAYCARTEDDVDEIADADPAPTPLPESTGTG